MSFIAKLKSKYQVTAHESMSSFATKIRKMIDDASQHEDEQAHTLIWTKKDNYISVAPFFGTPWFDLASKGIVKDAHDAGVLANILRLKLSID